MRKASRGVLIGTSLIGALCLPARVLAQQRPAIAEQIAKTYGLDAWDQVEAIRYTFNIDAPGFKIARSWVWEPKADRITYDGPDKAGQPLKVTYVRSQLGAQSDVVKQVVDPGFLNDQYVLLFPLRVAWDSGATVTDEGMQKLHLSKGTARKVSVKYPSDGGYTPGDTWDLYVGKDGRIQELVYHRGGPVKPTLIYLTWGAHKMVGPLLISLDKRGKADGKPAHVWYTNVAVKTVGSNSWMEAK